MLFNCLQVEEAISIGLVDINIVVDIDFDLKLMLVFMLILINFLQVEGVSTIGQRQRQCLPTRRDP